MATHSDGELGQEIDLNLQAVEKVADRSRNLKGNFVRGIRLAVLNIKAATEELARRTATSENIKRLERENTELRSQLASLANKTENLTREINLLRKQKADPSQTASIMSNRPGRVQQKIGHEEKDLMERIGSLIERKLAIFEAKIFPDRVIRPPLAGANKPQTTLPQLSAHPPQPLESQAPLQPQKAKRQRVKKKNKKSAFPPPAALPPVAAPVLNNSAPNVISWVEVAKKPKKARAIQKRSNTTASPLSTTQKRSNKKRILRAPTSAAVTVTVLDSSSVTYAKVMEEAKAKIHLADLGIETVRLKRAVTGGLLLEITGQDCGEKADKLAAKMREVLSDLNVRISRPIKTSDVRLRDLDDAVRAEEIAAAMAEAGGCSVDNIKVGEVRRTPTSMGTCWVRCPVVAIHKIAAVGRVRIGWGSARVEVLEPRPMHCFRCLERGHVASRCPNEVNRAERCYACGEPGHGAKQCTASEPRCPLCSDLGRPANHRLGKKCVPPPKKYKGRKNEQTPSASINTPDTATSVPAPSPNSAMEVVEK